MSRDSLVIIYMACTALDFLICIYIYNDTHIICHDNYKAIYVTYFRFEKKKKETKMYLNRNSLIKQPQDEDPDEGVKDLIEIVLRKLDKDKDGKISLEDYRQSVLEEPLLLEAFGRCLPNERARDTFLTTMKM